MSRLHDAVRAKFRGEAAIKLPTERAKKIASGSAADRRRTDETPAPIFLRA